MILPAATFLLQAPFGGVVAAVSVPAPLAALLVVVTAVGVWGAMADIIREERPPAFMLHAYGGSSEMTVELARLGGYFSFGTDLLKPGRARMRRALLAAPKERLLFETESPSRTGLTEVLRAAAAVLGISERSLGEISWNNARNLLGGLFPEDV